MKILTVVYDLDKGGTQRAAQNFCEAYQILGHDSQLLATQAGGPREIELHALEIPYFVGLTDDFIKHVKIWQPDIVHLHSHSLVKEEVLALKQYCQSAKFVETNVFSEPSSYPEDILEYSFQLSEWCQYLYLLRGGSENKSVIVPNPVKTAQFKRPSNIEIAEFRNKYSIPENAFVIGRIGQRHYAKWSHYLIELLDRLLKEVNADTYLVLVNAREELLEYAYARNLHHRIINIDSIHGDLELSRCYSAIDVFMHISSQGESFGYALAESLLCETPVIALNTPWSDNSQSETIGHGIGGYCANSREELFEYTKQLFHAKLLRQKLGSQGREKIITDYDYVAVAQKGLQILSGVRQPKTKVIINKLPAIQHFDFIKKVAVSLLLWVKFRNAGTARVTNYLLRKLYKHEIFYS
ncbi:glycosyltransferase family 4 protein [Dyadobacter crusticola]|uniref:glycosyltransferase family 4 protein n=1 Tax=Dyadobacter crusticola TaxID=292407 RepID=UPI0004E1FFFC|nr:glycosyltransferase family 4 protein [Dyadobacter crusticola]